MPCEIFLITLSKDDLYILKPKGSALIFIFCRVEYFAGFELSKREVFIIMSPGSSSSGYIIGLLSSKSNIKKKGRFSFPRQFIRAEADLIIFEFMKILLIDNYDSFTYNIAHIVKASAKTQIEIIKSDKLDLSAVDSYDKVIFSPGPDLPEKGNIMEHVLAEYGEYKSILGICLGLQAIVLYFGGKLVKLDEVIHGRTRTVRRTGVRSALFMNIPEFFEAGFYHSWIADTCSLPDCLEVTCYSDEGIILGVHHKYFDIEGVQFHPESIMTPHGERMIKNWLK